MEGGRTYGTDIKTNVYDLLAKLRTGIEEAQINNVGYVNGNAPLVDKHLDTKNLGGTKKFREQLKMRIKSSEIKLQHLYELDEYMAAIEEAQEKDDPEQANQAKINFWTSFMNKSRDLFDLALSIKK